MRRSGYSDKPAWRWVGDKLVIYNKYQELLDKQEQLNQTHLYSEPIVTTIRKPPVILNKA